MNELVTKNIKIENIIYEVREKQVMLDSDLAIIYKCKNGTKEINQAVKNNIKKFPERFSWRLLKEETDFLVKSFDQKVENRGRNSNFPRVFTEQGVAMLATILKTPVAVEVSIQIMDAFITMRKYISNELIEQKYINNMVLKHNDDIKIIQDSLNLISEKEMSNHIFFEGQIYDAYSLLMQILEKAKVEIIIIDNYAGRELFNLIKDIKIPIKIYSKNIDKQAILKYKSQYSNIEIINSDIFHDRFIILDKSILYHSGSSFKDLGKKCFAITLIEYKEILEKLLMELKI